MTKTKPQIRKTEWGIIEWGGPRWGDPSAFADRLDRWLDLAIYWLESRPQRVMRLLRRFKSRRIRKLGWEHPHMIHDMDCYPQDADGWPDPHQPATCTRAVRWWESFDTPAEWNNEQ